MSNYDREHDVLAEGSTIGGYTVGRILGRGGFGITYEASNPITRRRMAIKEFFPRGMARRDGVSGLTFVGAKTELVERALRKFEETTTTLCGLEHPNILQVHDYVPGRNTGYMIMELLEGQTLEHWLRARVTAPSLDELRPVIDPILDALIYVHANGLIHRDIAPDNILITDRGRPVVIDFGAISRDLRHAGHFTMGFTKEHYTAPEQMNARVQPTPEADIYSMCAVLYRAITGTPPTDGWDRLSAVFDERKADPYEPLTTLKPSGCPSRIADAIDRGLAIRKDDRIHSMSDLREALAPLASKPDTSAAPENPGNAASDELPAGTSIGGYVIRRTLRRDGFGITYDVFNRITDRAAAVKEFFPVVLTGSQGLSIAPKSISAKELLLTFEKNANILSELQHGAIVRCHDYLPANNTGYMIADFVEGINLADWLRSQDHVPGFELVLSLIDPLMDALVYMHGEGVTHGDIAPETILIASKKGPIFCDFNALTSNSPRHKTSQVNIIREHYTAPEISGVSARPSPHSDIYSMGALLYRALTGIAPKDAKERSMAALVGTLDHFLPLAGMANAGCPQPMALAIDRALSLSPQDRFPTIEAFRSELHAAVPWLVEASAGKLKRMFQSLMGRHSPR